MSNMNNSESKYQRIYTTSKVAVSGHAASFSKKISSLWILCLALTIAGCAGSGGSPDDNGNTCVTGCVGTKYVDCEAGTEEVCEYGCAENICHHEPSNCTPGTERCENGQHISCSSAGVLVTENCPYGCNGSECASKTTSTAKPCDGVVCANGGQCDRGICVSENMSNVSEGDDCDAWFQGFCNGNQRVTCDAGKIHFTDCSESGGCAMSKGKQDYCGGETYLFPTCRKDGPQCLDINKNGYCAIENNQGKTEAHAYGIACWENTDNTISGNRSSDSYVLCTLGCNNDKTGCLSRCEPDDTLHLYNDTLQYCANNANICVTLDGEGGCGEPCSQKGLETQQCFSGNARHRMCRNDDNGKLFFEDQICGCDHGCEEATGLCKKLVQDEYTACNWNTFKQRCDGKIRVACVNGRVRAEECSSTCEISQNAAVCPSRICSGTEITECADSNHSVRLHCAPADSGNLIPVKSVREECAAGCDYESNACYCNESSKNWCTGNNEVASCEGGHWRYDSCNEKTCAGGSCYAKVFNSQQECQNYVGSKKCSSFFTCRQVDNSSQFGIYDDNNIGASENCSDYANVEWCKLTYVPETIPDGTAAPSELEAYVQVYAPGITGRNGSHDDLNMYFTYIPAAYSVQGYYNNDVFYCTQLTPPHQITVKAQRNEAFSGEGSENNDEYIVHLTADKGNASRLAVAFYHQGKDKIMPCESSQNKSIDESCFNGTMCTGGDAQLSSHCNNTMDVVKYKAPQAEWCQALYDKETKYYYVQFYIPGVTGKQKRNRGNEDITVEVYGEDTYLYSDPRLNEYFDTNYETNNDEYMYSGPNNIYFGIQYKGYITVNGKQFTNKDDHAYVKCGKNGIFTGNAYDNYITK